MEEWRAVVGYEGAYEVSDQGRVRRIGGGMGARPGRILLPTRSSTGYLTVGLFVRQAVKRVGVHRLVVAAFYGVIPKGREVNHLNGNKTANHVSNLEIVTPSENRRHAWRVGLNTCTLAMRRSAAKLSDEQVRLIRRLSGGVSQCVLARRFGVNQSQISRLLSHQQWNDIHG